MNSRIKPIRLFAWGNRGRCDDGVALVIAERLEVRFADEPGVIIHQYHQLAPEIVEELDDCRLAIFLDAHVPSERAPWLVSRIQASAGGGLDTHACTPADLLGLMASLGLSPPEALLVSVRGEDMSYGERLSPATAAAARGAESWIVREMLLRLGSRTEPGRLAPGVLVS